MPQNFSILARDARLAHVSQAPVDLIVVGGGITGAGIAWDAALRGLSVVVLEKGDFASGTSSKSSKLLHGGVRYLEQAEFKLVFESLAQRNQLFLDAPHVAKKLDFMLPIVKGGNDNGPIIGIGLTLYDMLTKLSNRTITRWHQRLSQRAALAAEPHLRADVLKSAYNYTDGVTEDARLVVETLKSAEAAGAVAFNYVEVTRFIKDQAGRITGVEATDLLTNRPLALHAKVVFNATGPWADALARLDDPTARLHLKPTKGVHILTESFVSDHAVVLRSYDKKEKKPRVMFVIPWGGRTMIGTTDTAHEGDPNDLSYLDTDVNVTASEVQYLLDSVNNLFDVALTPKDVISSFAGWRPLAAPPDAGASESSISREYEIHGAPSGLISIAGGKLTAYRTMAAHSVDHVVKALQGLAPGRTFGKTTIEHRALSGSELASEALDAYVARMVAESPGLPEEVVAVLARRYGTNWPALKALMTEIPALSGRYEGLDADLAYYRVEPVYALLHEGATSVSDFLIRRTRLHLLDTQQGLGVAEAVSATMADTLAAAFRWTDPERDAWAAHEAGRYRTAVEARRRAREDAA
jgi:glycerol-3-phosphate dehydrogenase